MIVIDLKHLHICFKSLRSHANQEATDLRLCERLARTLFIRRWAPHESALLLNLFYGVYNPCQQLLYSLSFYLSFAIKISTIK